MTTELSTYEQQAIDFLNSTSTAITVKHKTYGKHFTGDKENRHIFRVRLVNKLGSYNFDFGQSIAAGSKEPTAYSILTCLTKYDPNGFDDFCSTYGFDDDSLSAYKTYKAVLKEWKAIERLFSAEQIEQLQEIQ